MKTIRLFGAVAFVAILCAAKCGGISQKEQEKQDQLAFEEFDRISDNAEFYMAVYYFGHIEHVNGYGGWGKNKVEAAKTIADAIITHSPTVDYGNIINWCKDNGGVPISYAFREGWIDYGTSYSEIRRMCGEGREYIEYSRLDHVAYDDDYVTKRTYMLYFTPSGRFDHYTTF